MTTLRVGPFLGANLALRPRLLPDGMGVMSLNHRSDQGDLRPWNVPLTVAAAGASTSTIHMLARDTTADSIVWLKWNTVVHAIRSYRSDDATKRTYYTGSGAPKVTDNIIGLDGSGSYPASYRDLGVPKPMTAPTLTQTTAGTGDDEERFYAYTYLTDWDEEGMPQIAGPITCKPGAVIAIGNLSLPPSGAGENRGINRIRIYRTVTGNDTSEFYFLRDITPATSTEDDGRATGTDVMPSAKYAVPPADLKCLTALWNGMAAGISGKAVRYCEINRLHAWPAAYETLCQDTPVALSAWAGNLLVTTTGRPRLVTGSVPEAMSDVPVEFVAANVSQRSAVAFGHGAVWASKDGLAYYGDAGPRFLTAKLLTLEQWRALNPESIVGAQWKGLYLGFYLDGATYKGFWIDPLAPENGIYFLSEGYRAVFYDELGEELYVLGADNNIKRWNGGAAKMTVSHKTKVYRLTAPADLALGQVIGDTYPVTLTVHRDGLSPYSITVVDGEPFWLHPGTLSTQYQFEFSTTGDALAAVFSDDMDEFART